MHQVQNCVEHKVSSCRRLSTSRRFVAHSTLFEALLQHCASPLEYACCSLGIRCLTQVCAVASTVEAACDV